MEVLASGWKDEVGCPGLPTDAGPFAKLRIVTNYEIAGVQVGYLKLKP